MRYFKHKSNLEKESWKISINLKVLKFELSRLQNFIFRHFKLVFWDTQQQRGLNFSYF